MPDAHANFATSYVATAPSPALSGTTLIVAAGTGSRYPATPFNAVVCPAADAATPANAEVVRVTGRTGDTLTIARAQESSTARTIQAGDRIYAGVTAKTLTDVENEVVIGPGSVTADHIAQFDGTTGKLIKDGGVLGTAAHAATGDFDAAGAAAAALATAEGYTDTASGLLVPKSLVDAKGDLIVATADNAVARKAVGADGYVLAADSSKSDGLDWVPRAVRSIIDGEESTASNSYTLLTTNDTVTLTLIAGQVVVVNFMALYKMTGASGAGAIALYVDGAQLKTQVANAVPAAQEASVPTSNSFYGWVNTFAPGLVLNASTTSDSSSVATGLSVLASNQQGTIIFDLPAGSHTFDVRVKAGTGGTLYMKERKLIARAV